MMAELTWEKITDIYGRIQAEMLKTFFESEGLPVQLIQEGVGEYVLPFTFGPLAKVQVFVPKEKLAQARLLLEAFERGDADMKVAEDDPSNDKE